jgi:hypothetical protein
MAETPQSEVVAVATVTPVMSKDVDFTTKMDAVDAALKDRAKANKDIKIKWAGVVKVLVEFGQKPPTRRLDAIGAANLVPNLSILVPEDERLKDKEKVAAARDGNYGLRELVKHRKFMAVMEAKFPNFTKFSHELLDLYELSSTMREEDEDATHKAQKKLQAAVDAYVEALEAYDDTVESVANVKEYVSVVKDVAEISAIAQGQLRPGGRE